MGRHMEELMKTLNQLKTGIFFASIVSCVAVAAPEAEQQSQVMDCEFVNIVPENADFFTSHFRPFPVVGTQVRIDFGAPAITSMVFSDGQVFFAEGDATLTKLTRFGQADGFGGVRLGNQGFYIGQLTQPQEDQNQPGTYTSRLALTNAYRDGNFHLATQETNYGDLLCHLVEAPQD